MLNSEIKLCISISVENKTPRKTGLILGPCMICDL